jgi:sigma-B regulation protein RsbU (phosphoserine phosphatase)
MASAVSDADSYALAACGLLTLGLDGQIERANATFCHLIGWDATSLVGKKRFQELLTMGSRVFHHTHWMPLLQMQRSVAEVQLELVHRDGRTLAALVNAVIQAGPEGRESVQVAVFIATDRRKYERELLLARRRAEELLASEREAQQARTRAEGRLRLALDAARLYTWNVELPSGAASYEPRVGALLGAEMDSVPADMYANAIHEDDRERERAAFAEAVDPNQRALYSTEYRLLGLDGVERIIHAVGRAVFDEAGVAVGLTGVLADLTSRRRAEDALKAQEREAEQRAVLVEQLIGIVSHDLRNPLNAVLLGTHLLRTHELSVNDARVVARIASSAERATRLVADLLDFTQARLGGGLRVAPRPVDFHALVLECVEELKLAWPGRMIAVQARGSGDVELDPDRLSQVVGNLASNALSYGTVEQPITISSCLDDDRLELAVHNHGRPIPAALIPQMFEPLRRGDHNVKLGSRSIGLGLFIVRQIAAAHGGSVTVTSNDTDGTTFVLRIPRVKT